MNDTATASAAKPATDATGAAKPKVPRRVAAVIINSLKGGVVPRIGLPYITVGRHDARSTPSCTTSTSSPTAAPPSASSRARYGSGKSFLLQTIRNHAMDSNGFAVCGRRPLARSGGCRAPGVRGSPPTSELIQQPLHPDPPRGRRAHAHPRPLAQPACRAERALESGRRARATIPRSAGQVAKPASTPSMRELPERDGPRLRLRSSCSTHLPPRLPATGTTEAQANVAKWLRGEYRTKTEARAELGVNVIITDDDWYDYLKLFACFLRGAGYKGLLVLVDELVNLYKIPNAITRQYNYEKILTMYNDTLQGKARHLGIIMGGTPQSIEDRRRGIYSYEALRSRLAQGRFAGEGLMDLLAPVIRLEPLTHEELLVLIEKLADIHAGLFGYERTLGEDDLVAFLRIEFGRVGASTHLTPREVIRDFVELLDIVSQNPQVDVAQLLESDAFEYAQAPEPGMPDGFATSADGATAIAESGSNRGEARGSSPSSPYAEFTI